MLKITGVLCVMIISSILISCGKDADPLLAPLLEVSIGEMAKDYHANAFRADEKYDRSLLVSGRVNEIQRSGALQLAVGGYNQIEAAMDDREDLLALNRGDKVDLRCDRATGTTDTLGVFLSFSGCAIYDPFEHMHEEQKAAGKSNTAATAYATVYSRLIEDEGKSRVFARTYVEIGGGLPEGRSDKYAYVYATLIEQGKSTSYAHSYATEIIVGKSHEEAAKIADRWNGKAGEPGRRIMESQITSQ